MIETYRELLHTMDEGRVKRLLNAGFSHRGEIRPARMALSGSDGEAAHRAGFKRACGGRRINEGHHHLAGSHRLAGLAAASAKSELRFALGDADDTVPIGDLLRGALGTRALAIVSQLGIEPGRFRCILKLELNYEVRPGENTPPPVRTEAGAGRISYVFRAADDRLYAAKWSGRNTTAA